MTPADEQIKLMDDILSFFIDKQTVISDIKFFSYKFNVSIAETRAAFNTLCPVLDAEGVAITKTDSSDNYKILSMDLDKAAMLKDKGGFKTYFKSVYIEPQRHTLVFNAGAPVTPAQDVQVTTNRVNPADEETIVKENWFEAALWVGGGVAILIAIVTLVI